MSQLAKAKSVRRLALLGLAVLVGLGCAPVSLERNPFLTYAGAFGFLDVGDDGASGRRGDTGEEIFRDEMNVTFVNLHNGAHVSTSYVAWVNVSSVRSADQQDALLRAGYVQLVEELTLGSVFTLPVGTFVYNGPGKAGATPVRLGSPELPGGLPTEISVNLVTPDVFLMYYHEPVSCDSVAFAFLNFELGTVLTGPTTGAGGFKTYSEVDAYQCDPLRPGFFLDVDAGTQEPNEYTEGAQIVIEFTSAADNDGNYARVTVTN